MTSNKQLCFGARFDVRQLKELTTELQDLRDYPPLTQRSPGKYEGDILGFVKGLRLSARVIYFLRDRLDENVNIEVHWGQILDETQGWCSPECDVIIHEKCQKRKWNGSEHPVMDFRFIEMKKVKAVVSCKSKLDKIDNEYPKTLRKYGVKTVFLFAECCSKSSYNNLKRKAKESGYKGLWTLYHINKDGSFLCADEREYKNFSDEICKTVNKKKK